MSERTTRQVSFMCQPGLFEAFQAACQLEHRNVSEVIRELMARKAEGWIQVPGLPKPLVEWRPTSEQERQKMMEWIREGVSDSRPAVIL